MAEMQTADSGGHKKGKKVRSKKISTRIDFTPMVDLGFLLITFFMLTTTLQKPQTMQIFLPEKADDIDQPKVKESKVLTLLLGKNDKEFESHAPSVSQCHSHRTRTMSAPMSTMLLIHPVPNAAPAGPTALTRYHGFDA